MKLIRAPRAPEWLPKIGLRSQLRIGIVKLNERWRPYFQLSTHDSEDELGDGDLDQPDQDQ